MTPLGLADLLKARQRHWLEALGAKKAGRLGPAQDQRRPGVAVDAAHQPEALGQVGRQHPPLLRAQQAGQDRAAARFAAPP